jgi:hypothetical protein
MVVKNQRGEYCLLIQRHEPGKLARRATDGKLNDKRVMKYGQRESILSIVCSTTAFPNPRGIYKTFRSKHHQKSAHSRNCEVKSKGHTMLNQDCIGPESSCIIAIRLVARKGNEPKIRLIILYLPVRCIIHPAKTEPNDIETLFGSRCKPTNIDRNLISTKL